MATSTETDFSDIFDRLPLGKSGVRVERSRTELAQDPVVTVVPTDAGSSVIHASLDPEFGVYLRFGVGSVFEIPFKGTYYTQLSWKEETEVLCRAVISGGFSEDLYVLFGRVWGGKAQIRIDPDRYIVQTWGWYPLLWFWKKPVHIDYLPY